MAPPVRHPIAGGAMGGSSRADDKQTWEEAKKAGAREEDGGDGKGNAAPAAVAVAIEPLRRQKAVP